MISIMEDRPGLATTLRRKGFEFVTKPSGSHWWVATIKGETIELPDDLDKWEKGEPPKEGKPA